MKTIRIVWLTPYRRGHVADVIRGIGRYTAEGAQAQIAIWQAIFPGNRYSTEPI